MLAPPHSAGIIRLNLSNRFSPVASADCSRPRKKGSGISKPVPGTRDAHFGPVTNTRPELERQ